MLKIVNGVRFSNIFGNCDHFHKNFQQNIGAKNNFLASKRLSNLSKLNQPTVLASPLTFIPRFSPSKINIPRKQNFLSSQLPFRSPISSHHHTTHPILTDYVINAIKNRTTAIFYSFVFCVRVASRRPAINFATDNMSTLFKTSEIVSLRPIPFLCG